MIMSSDTWESNFTVRSLFVEIILIHSNNNFPQLKGLNKKGSSSKSLSHASDLKVFVKLFIKYSI